MMMGTNKDLPDDVAYALTKSFFENLDAMKSTNALLERLDLGDPVARANMPLHPVAARHYEEQGIDIPDRLKAE